MQVTSTVVLLTAVVMAQADEMSDVLKLPPHKDHMYILDVTTEASVDDLKASLVNFTIEDWYKVLGEQQYLIVFNSNDTAALYSLTFPAASKVTQIAVKHLNEHLDMFKTGSGMEDKYIPFTNPDSVLLYMKGTFRVPQTVCSKTHELMMKAFTEGYRRLFNTTRPRIYSFIASYPPGYVEFLQMEENAFQSMTRKLVDILGGQGLHDLSSKRIARVSL